MRFQFDVIITTYNRPEIVINFVNQLLLLDPQPHKLIVVDSSDKENDVLKTNHKVKYLRSSHKSQPYQRYVGVLASEAEILVFFDDDLYVKRIDLFEKILEGFQDSKIVGISLGIDYQNGIPLNQTNKKSTLSYTGQISWLGRTTGLPIQNQEVQYFPGPNMAFRGKITKQLFDPYMFFIFEKRIGIPEDKVISMRASKYGKLYYYGADSYLFHPPIESTYFNNEVDFYAKDVFSRLWVNVNYAKIRKKSLLNALLVFVLYFVKYFVDSVSSANSNRLKGSFKACGYILKYNILVSKKRLHYYYEDARKDAKSCLKIE